MDIAEADYVKPFSKLISRNKTSYLENFQQGWSCALVESWEENNELLRLFPSSHWTVPVEMNSKEFVLMLISSLDSLGYI